jgi:hypothetical protein
MRKNLEKFYFFNLNYYSKENTIFLKPGLDVLDFLTITINIKSLKN